MTMFCERYKCTMPEKTCLLRQKKYDSHVAYNTGNRDPGCANCAQGKQIKTQMKGTIMTHTAAVETQTPAAGKAAGMNVAAELDALQAAADKRKDRSVPAAEPRLKRCPKCKRHLPADLEHFYEDIRGKLKLSCWCKECQRARGRKSKREKATAGNTGDRNKVPAKEVPEITPPAPPAPRPRRTVTLDFTDRPRMLDRIETAAKRDFRTVEQQLLFWAALTIEGIDEQLNGQTDDTPWWAQEETA
jgi:hypothetical protein